MYCTTALVDEKIVEPGKTLEKLLMGPCHGADDNERKIQESQYRIVFEEFLPCVIGEHVWKRDRGKKLLQDYATVSDEGFVLLVLENFDCTWSDMSAGKLEQSVWKKRSSKRKDAGQEPLDESQKAAKPRYSDGGSGTNDHQGWKEDGHIRFRSLCLIVKSWRMQASYKSMERRLLADYKHRQATVTRRPVNLPKENEPVGYDDWDDFKKRQTRGTIDELEDDIVNDPTLQGMAEGFAAEKFMFDDGSGDKIPIAMVEM